MGLFVKKAVTLQLSAILLTAIILLSASAVYLWGIPLLRKNEARNNAKIIESVMLELASSIENVAIEGGSEYVNVPNTNAPIRLYRNRVESEVEVPMKMYSEVIKVVLNDLTYYVNSSPIVINDGEWYSDGTVNITFNSGIVCFSDNITEKSKCFNSDTNVITSTYVYNVKIQGTQTTITAIEKSGIAGKNPACIVFASGIPLGDGQIVKYNLVCRELVDVKFGKCYDIIFYPSGKTLIQQESRKIKLVKVRTSLESENSTVCDIETVIEVKLEVE